MEEKQLSPEQSLKLITEMISKTRQHLSDNSIYFLVWGWLTFIAFIAQFILKHIINYEKHYLVWLVVIIGIIFSVYQGRRQERKPYASTYIDDSMKFVWAGMAVSFFVLSLIFSKMGWGFSVYPFFMLLYGLGTFVSGKILRFRPLETGGILAWVLAYSATYFSYDYQMLFGAAAILFSYIVPAHIMRGRNSRITSNKVYE